LSALLGEVRKTVEVRIFAPKRDDENTHICTYEIFVDDMFERKSYALGNDGVQALLLALWKVEIDLQHMSPFKEMVFDIDDQTGFGFIHAKRVWDSVYQ